MANVAPYVTLCVCVCERERERERERETADGYESKLSVSPAQMPTFLAFRDKANSSIPIFLLLTTLIGN